MKTGIKSAEESHPFPVGMSRAEVLAKLRIVLKNLRWTFAENSGGFSATTPLTLKSTGETVDIEVGTGMISIRSHGGMATFALTSKKYHIANVESVINEFISISNYAENFNHDEFIEKITKAFTLMKAGILSVSEFQQTKSSLLHNLNRNTLAISPTSFLLELAPLLEKGAITIEELNAVKANIL